MAYMELQSFFNGSRVIFTKMTGVEGTWTGGRPYSRDGVDGDMAPIQLSRGGRWVTCDDPRPGATTCLRRLEVDGVGEN